MNYWIFQGKPTAYDFNSAIKKEVLKTWDVKQHFEIKKGDKAIIWICGKRAGCYGIADIFTNPENLGRTEDYNEWNPNDETGKRLKKEVDTTKSVKIDITLFSKFIPKDKIPDTYGPLATLKLRGGIQGTNFTLSKEQYEMIVNLKDY